MKEEFKFSIKQPRDKVFALMTDMEKLAELSRGKVTIKPSTEPRDCVLQADFPGLETVVCRTTEWDPPRKCVREFQIKDLPTTLSLLFVEEAEGTQVALTLEMTPQNMAYKMMLPMLESQLKKERDKALARLRSQLDGT